MGKGWSDGDELSIAEQRVKENLVVIKDAEDVDVGLSVEIIDDRSSRIQIQVTANFTDCHFRTLMKPYCRQAMLCVRHAPEKMGLISRQNFRFALQEGDG